MASRCVPMTRIMPPITALVHTHNDEFRIGRCLETLRPCDEFLVVDSGSTDRTVPLAREYGAVIVQADLRDGTGRAAASARCGWIFCLRPIESITEALEASLFEWKLHEERDIEQIAGAAVFVREESDGSWVEGAPELRLVRRTWTNWEGFLPVGHHRCMLMQGDLLRFRQP